MMNRSPFYNNLAVFSFLVLTAVSFLCCCPFQLFAEDPSPTSVDLIECGDRKLAFKMFCNPRWQTSRKTLSLKLVIDGTPQREVSVTVSKSEEVGLSYEDLKPVALKRVFEYADEFKYAKTYVNWNRVIRVEAQPQGQPETYLLDYFLIRDSQLYRISYSAQSREQFRKYLPLFAEMMRSFEFINVGR